MGTECRGFYTPVGVTWFVTSTTSGGRWCGRFYTPVGVTWFGTEVTPYEYMLTRACFYTPVGVTCLEPLEVADDGHPYFTIGFYTPVGVTWFGTAWLAVWDMGPGVSIRLL